MILNIGIVQKIGLDVTCRSLKKVSVVPSLTNADDDEGGHSVENAEVTHTKDHVVQEQSHQAAQPDAYQPEEREEHWRDKHNKETTATLTVLIKLNLKVN